MAAKKKTNALAPIQSVGRSLTEFAKQAEVNGNGAGLVEAALNKFKADEKQAIVGKINELVKHIRSLYANRDKLDVEIKLFENRLEEVHAGNFKVDSSGHVHFKDGFYI